MYATTRRDSLYSANIPSYSPMAYSHRLQVYDSSEGPVLQPGLVSADCCGSAPTLLSSVARLGGDPESMYTVQASHPLDSHPVHQ